MNESVPEIHKIYLSNNQKLNCIIALHNHNTQQVMFVEAQKQIGGHLSQKGEGHGDSEDSHPSQENQESQENIQSLSEDDDSDQLSSPSPPIEAAIKTMQFREKRGTKIKDLLSGQINHDKFWEQHCNYFGGDLRLNDEEQDEEDYEQSSSGQDEFDSDFNNTDSYPGKRGRKKGTKVKKRLNCYGSKRGRPKKQVVERSSSSQSKAHKQRPKRLKKQIIKKQKIQEVKKVQLKYKKVQEKTGDFFLVLKAEIRSNRGRKPKLLIKQQKNNSEQKQEL